MGAKLDPDEQIVKRYEYVVLSQNKSGKVIITNKGIIFKSNNERDSYKIHNITGISEGELQGNPIIEVEYLDKRRSLRNVVFHPAQKSEIVASSRICLFLYFLNCFYSCDRNDDGRTINF